MEDLGFQAASSMPDGADLEVGAKSDGAPGGAPGGVAPGGAPGGGPGGPAFLNMGAFIVACPLASSAEDASNPVGGGPPAFL